MPDPFASPRLLLTRAKKNFAKLKRSAKAFVKKEPYEMFCEANADNPDLVTYKVRMTKELPDVISEHTGHIVNGLRSSLDHALHVIARASGCKKRQPDAHFPFSKDFDHFENNLKGRCKDVPQEIWPLLRSFQPYKGGEDFLFALNEVCNSNKHAIVVPIVNGSFAAGISAMGTGFITMPCDPKWDHAKNEMELITVSRTTTEKFEYKFNLVGDILFGEVGLLTHHPILPNIVKFIWMVGIILDEIETESRRLGIVK